MTVKDYVVDFEYVEPRWGAVELEAENIDEARDLADREIGQQFPEALDVKISGVRELDANN